MENDSNKTVLKKAVVWKELYFYRKSDTVYQLTVEFCKRFLPHYGDRTVDQMVQAARSGKQKDYLNTHHLETWAAHSNRQKRLREFCHSHNDYEAYAPFVGKMNDEEMANMLLTLCHQTDKMMCAYIKKLEHRFVTEGGIKERMYAVRTGYRQQQENHLRTLEAENQQLKAENAALRRELEEMRARLGLGEPRMT